LDDIVQSAAELKDRIVADLFAARCIVRSELLEYLRLT
jgi:hypothetical protein